MKTTILVLLSSFVLCSGQNILVKFYPDNQPYSGLTNYPAVTQPVSWSTNTIGWNTNMTLAAYAAYKDSFSAQYAAGESNATYQAQAALNANVARLLTLYNGIPSARTQLRSFANGTNTLTTAQLTTATRQLADYTEKLMEFIQRLGPVLKEIYKPEQDSTQ